jgi:hypothetical protein
MSALAHTRHKTQDGFLQLTNLPCVSRLIHISHDAIRLGLGVGYVQSIIVVVCLALTLMWH